MPDELEWRPSSMAFFLEGRSWPFTSPLHLLRFGPLSPPARIRMGLAVLKLQKTAHEVGPFESITAREWIRRNMGEQPYEKVWGPLLRGKFGDRADDISMAWLWGKLTMRRKLEGKEARQELLGYPGRSWEPLFHELQTRIEAGGGRVLIDRPAARLAQRPDGFEVTAGAPGSFRARPRPAGVRGRRQPRRYDAVVATVPNDVFERMLDLAAARRPTSSGCAASSTTPRSACCSSSTGGSARTTGPTSPTRSCRSSAWSSTPTSSSPSATTAGASSTSPTTSRPATRCSSSTPSS